MLEIPRSPIRHSQTSDMFGEIQLDHLVRSSLQGIRRQWALIAAAILAMGAIAFLVVLTSTPLFTATAGIIIDPRMNANGDAPSAPMLLFSDALVVDSEVEVLRSADLAQRVIDKLDLLNDPAFTPSPGPLSQIVDGVKGWLDGSFATDEESAVDEGVNPEEATNARRESALRRFNRGLDVTRAGDTYVITVAYTSQSPYLSSKIANALVDEYFLAQAEATYENVRRVSEWLGTRTELLSRKVIEADRAVEDYKREHNLFNVQDDKLPNQQELTVANDQLIAARSQILDLEARQRQLDHSIATGAVNAAISVDPKDTSLDELQTTYGQLVSRERDMSTRYGPNHGIAVRLRSEIASTEQSILDEYRRISGINRNQLAVFRAQEADAQTRVDQLRTAVSQDANRLIRLRELERESTSTRTLYEGMLGKFQQSSQNESYSSSPARVIERATPPSEKSSPRSKMIVALGLFCGGVLGVGLAFLREQMDDVFRAATDAEDVLGVPLLGIVPFFGADRRVSQRAIRAGPPVLHGRKQPDATRAYPRRALTCRFAVDHPMSIFAETLRSIAFAVNSTKSDDAGRVIGVTSVAPSEGKSTLASNLASYLASVGNRVALLDYDVRNPNLTRLIDSSDTSAKLGQLLQHDESFVLQRNDLLEGAVFIGNDGNALAYNPSDVGYIRAMEALVQRLRSEFDIVVLDLPPAANLIDARIAATMVDHVLFATEWGKTRRTIARNVVLGSPQLKNKIFGVVYTKVKLSAYNKYNTNTPGGYYQFTHA